MSTTSNSRTMISLKQIDEGMDDMIDWDEWYFVLSDEAEPEGGKREAKEEGVEDDEMKEEEEEERGEAKEESEEDEEMKEEEEESEEIFFMESGTKMGSSSMDIKHHEAGLQFGRLQFSPLFKKKESKDIKVLAKDYVLPFLPAKSLVRFRAVSMEWDQWIRSPFLAHQQSYSFQQLSGYFYQQNEENIEFLSMNRCAFGVASPSLSFLPESVTIKSSSNGLLLCQDQNGYGYNTYYVCNPVNKEWKELPPPLYYHGPETAVVLAFEPSVLNMDAGYQLICAEIDQKMICFEVYSSETRSWTESTTICLELEAGSTLRDNGFYIKGTTYWETSSRKVLAFNPANAIHEIIALPHDCPHGGILTQMNEELCYIGISNINENNDCFVEVYGGLYLDLKFKMKLHLQMSLNQYRVLPCLNGNIVMILNGCAIHSYSLKDEKLEVIGWHAGRSEAATYLPYVNSLVSVG